VHFVPLATQFFVQNGSKTDMHCPSVPVKPQSIVPHCGSCLTHSPNIPACVHVFVPVHPSVVWQDCGVPGEHVPTQVPIEFTQQLLVESQQHLLFVFQFNPAGQQAPPEHKDDEHLEESPEQSRPLPPHCEFDGLHMPH
jgi:hypothetical protein